MKVNKRKIFESIRSTLSDQMADAERARQDSQNEANRHIGRMQSRYDTFKEEAQAMAAAHELRKIELQHALSIAEDFLSDIDELKTGGMAQLGSVITLETLDGQKQECVILSPVGGGIELEAGEKRITVITPASPLGKALLGRVGEEKIVLELGNKTTTRAILEVI